MVYLIVVLVSKSRGRFIVIICRFSIKYIDNMKIVLNNVSENIKKILTENKTHFVEVNNIYLIKKVTSNADFDLLITDISGFDREIFSIIEHCTIPVVAEINYNSTLEAKTEAQEKGAVAFINSEADKFELLNIIKLVLQADKELIFENTIIDMISSPVFIKDKNLNFIACNETFCTRLGKTKDELIGKKSKNILTKNRANINEQIDSIVIETGEKREYESILKYSDDTAHNVIVNKSPFYNSNNEIVGIIGVITDITQQKKYEKELEKAKENAEQADTMKTSFLSNMSHEIRTPMNAIVGFSQLLSTPNLTEEKKLIYIEQVNQNADQLLKLIDDIIEVSRLESGKIKINKEPCFINKILSDIKYSFETHKARLGKNHIELIVNAEIKDDNFTIVTDPFRINQIFTNLIANALKFTEEGSVEFGYTCKKIGVDEFLEFYVKDTGLGIKSEKLVYIFDRFSKIPASKTKLYGGTGLGLSISKGLTEMLGGIIAVDSEENRGTTFRFSIPSEIYENTKSDNIIIPDKDDFEEIIPTHNWSNKNILIVEDEEMNYLFIREILRESNANIIWKNNGKKAFDEVKTNKNIDIILMDVKMPVMDGYTATEEIKKIRPEIPIIIQSAYAMPDEKEKGFQAGCDEYLEKPIKKDILLKVLSDFL